MAVQALINAASAGDIIDLGGATHNETSALNVDRRVTIRNGTIAFPDNWAYSSPGISVTASGLSMSQPLSFENLTVTGSGCPINTVDVGYIKIKHSDFTGNTGAFLGFWNDSHDILVENCTGTQTLLQTSASPGRATVVIRDEEMIYNLHNITIRRCTWISGPFAHANQAPGGMGIEAKACRSGLLIEQCDFVGGWAHVSLPDSEGVTLRRNRHSFMPVTMGAYTLPAYWGVEVADGGPCTIEDSYGFGTSPTTVGTSGDPAFISTNSGPSQTNAYRNYLRDWTVFCNTDGDNRDITDNDVSIGTGAGQVQLMFRYESAPYTNSVVSNNGVKNRPIILWFDPGPEDGVYDVAADDTVTITGIQFGATQGTGTVTLDGVEQAIVEWADDEITYTVTQGALETGSHDVVVTNDDGIESTALAQNLTSLPAVAGLAYARFATQPSLRAAVMG